MNMTHSCNTNDYDEIDCSIVRARMLHDICCADIVDAEHTGDCQSFSEQNRLHWHILLISVEISSHSLLAQQFLCVFISIELTIMNNTYKMLHSTRYIRMGYEQKGEILKGRTYRINNRRINIVLAQIRINLTFEIKFHWLLECKNASKFQLITIMDYSSPWQPWLYLNSIHHWLFSVHHFHAKRLMNLCNEAFALIKLITFF